MEKEKQSTYALHYLNTNFVKRLLSSNRLSTQQLSVELGWSPDYLKKFMLHRDLLNDTHLNDIANYFNLPKSLFYKVPSLEDKAVHRMWQIRNNHYHDRIPHEKKFSLTTDDHVPLNAEVFEALAKGRHYTRSKIANKLGVSSSAIYNWVNHLSFVTKTNIEELASVLGVKHAEILVDEYPSSETMLSIEKARQRLRTLPAHHGRKENTKESHSTATYENNLSDLTKQLTDLMRDVNQLKEQIRSLAGDHTLIEQDISNGFSKQERDANKRQAAIMGQLKKNEKQGVHDD